MVDFFSFKLFNWNEIKFKEKRKYQYIEIYCHKTYGASRWLYSASDFLFRIRLLGVDGVMDMERST